MPYIKFHAISTIVLEKKSFKRFFYTFCWYGHHVGQVNWAILKFGYNWPSGFWADIWKI